MRPETTLYERWQAVVAAQRDELALVDAATGRRWTFSQLAREADRAPGVGGPVVFPSGMGAEFLLAILSGWRDGRIVCPLEVGQTAPSGPWPGAPCVHLKTTSATTGRPRLIAFNAAQLATDAANLVATMGLRPDWPNVAVLSLAHSYGFSNLVTPLLLHGIPLHLAGSALPEALRRAATGLAAVTLPAVPALWRAWQEARAIPAQVRLAISAGAPLPLALEHEVFATTGLKLHNFYGASECGGIAYDGTERPRADATLAGTPVANVALAVAADGCLEIRGPNVATRYWPEADPVLADGCYHAADLAEMRAEGVFLLGRASEVINVAGRKVAPETIERALLEHPAVREALVLGLPAGGGREETIAAVVVPSRPVTDAELRTHLLHRLPAWQVPRRWHWATEPLANQRGKTSRAIWRNRLA